MYQLPKEILSEILLFLRYKEIKCFRSAHPLFAKFCKDENIIEKLKMKGFPRSTGHCESHDVYKFAGNYNCNDNSDYSDDDNNDVLPSLYDLLLSSSNNYNMKQFDYVQNLVLDELYGNNIDLIRGDLILFDKKHIANNGVYIFDGLNIIDLDYKVEDYGFLPEEFVVINNNVPINYWENITKITSVELVTVKLGIRYCNKFWFNHLPVQDQCLNNLRYIGTDSRYIILTNFTYNNKNYVIFDHYGYFKITDFIRVNLNFDYDKNTKDVLRQLRKFKNLLKNTNNLLLNNVIASSKTPLYNDIKNYFNHTFNDLIIIHIKLNHWRNTAFCF